MNLECAFSLSPPRSGDVPTPQATNGDASSSFFAVRFFLARGNVGVAPALAGPRGTTAARSRERGPNTPDSRCNGNRGGGIKLASRDRNCTGVITRCVAPLRLGLRRRYATRPSASIAQALQASFWARAVAAQAFQSFAVARAHGDACMHVEPRRFRHPRALARCAKPSLLSRERRWRAISREAHVGASEEAAAACTLRAARARALRSSGLLLRVRRGDRGGAASDTCASRRARQHPRCPRAWARGLRETRRPLPRAGSAREAVMQGYAARERPVEQARG